MLGTHKACFLCTIRKVSRDVWYVALYCVMHRIMHVNVDNYPRADDSCLVTQPLGSIWSRVNYMEMVAICKMISYHKPTLCRTSYCMHTSWTSHVWRAQFENTVKLLSFISMQISKRVLDTISKATRLDNDVNCLYIPLLNNTSIFLLSSGAI
jgi:hypothetical protein